MLGKEGTELIKGIRVEIAVDGTLGASRAVMALEPAELEGQTERFLKDMAAKRESRGIMGEEAQR